MPPLREQAGMRTGNLESLLDAIPDPTIVTDSDGTIHRLNRSAAELLGYSRTDLEGRALSELISEDLRSHYTDHRMALLASGENTGPELETRFLAADSSLIPIDASVGVLYLHRAPYILLVMREVSDRLATQTRLEQMVAIDELTTSISSRLNTPDFDLIDQAISESIQELAAFCSGGASAYLFTGTESDTFRLHSQSTGEAGAVVAIGPEELPWVRTLLGRGTITEVNFDAITVESADDCRRLQNAGVTSLVIMPLRASGHTIGFAGIESTDRGRPAWPGEDLAGLIVLQDVFENALERKRIGSELRRVNRVLHAVSECHDALIRAEDEKELLRDVCRIVVEAGGYALAWVGYPLDNEAKQIEAQAQWGAGNGYVESLNLSWGADSEGGDGPTGSAFRTRTPHMVQDTSLDPDLRWHSHPNQYGFLSLVTVPVFYGDEVAGTLAVYDHQANAFDTAGMKVLQRFADDLAYGIAALRARARQKKAEARLRELLESKDGLIATIAHELRTPLAGVVGFAQVLRDDNDSLDTESRAEMVHMIAEQGMDLTNIVDDLLVAAKSEAGTLTVANVEVDLRAQAAQVLEAWGSGVRGRVEFNGPSSTSTGDPARVRQILRNLISNALHYGGEHITVTVGAHEQSAYVEVEDDGQGIALEEQEAIFEPYRRAHDAPGLTASMGLGLSISRHLAELMGGTLTYVKEPERSVFTLAMPTMTNQAAVA